MPWFASLYQIFVGKFPAVSFIDNDVRNFIKSFNDNFVVIDLALKKRNESLDRPYTYMLPLSGIPNSITIWSMTLEQNTL